MEDTRTYTVVIERDEDGVYIATIPAFPGVVEQGKTEEEAYERVTEAGFFTLKSMNERGEEIPPSDAGHQVLREVELACRT
jgi:predicted RNase H-like HicB family nuclease